MEASLGETPLRRSVARFGRGLAEIIVSALIAPLMMIIQPIAVAEILASRDVGWQTQSLDDGTVKRRELYRKYDIPTLCVLAFDIVLPDRALALAIVTAA